MSGIITIEDIEARVEQIHRAQRERAEREARCEVDYADCFLSIRAENEHLDVLDRQREIIENGGTAWFWEYATLDGELVEARWCDTKYGRRLRAEMPDGSVVWTSARTEKGLAAKGLKEVHVKRVAWADFGGYGWARVFPSKLNRATGEYVDDSLVEVE